MVPLDKKGGCSMDMKLHNTILGMLSVVSDAALVLQANLRKIMKDNIEGASLVLNITVERND